MSYLDQFLASQATMTGGFESHDDDEDNLNMEVENSSRSQNTLNAIILDLVEKVYVLNETPVSLMYRTLSLSNVSPLWKEPSTIW